MFSSLSVDDCYCFLNKYNIDYIETELYLEYKDASSFKGWIFFIPISRRDFLPLLENLLPFLVANDFPFKVCKSDDAYKMLWNENRGLSVYGKVICIYPIEQSSILDIARKLILFSEGYKGGIVYAATRISNLLFTNYKGNSENDYNSEQKNENIYVEDNMISSNFIFHNYDDIDWPFSEITLPQFFVQEKQVLFGKYKVLSVLRSSVKGLVIKASYLDGILFMKVKYCIIKIGVKGMCMDWFGRDIIDRLHWQKMIQEKLYKIIDMPKILDCFEDSGNEFLVMEFIEGGTLQEYKNSIIGFSSWNDIHSKNKKVLLIQILKVIKLVNKMHQMGYIHRDLTFANIIINSKNRPVFIDLELSYSNNERFPEPPFPLGTVGFMSPEQEKFDSPEYNQDVYYIGTLLLASVTGLLPWKFDRSSSESLFTSLIYFVGDTAMVELIVSCIDEDPAKRPHVKFIQTQLEMIISRLDDKSVGKTVCINTGRNQLDIIIQGVINNLASSIVRDKIGYWVSPINPNVLNIERRVFDGLYHGISGILYLISVSKLQGYHTSHLNQIIVSHVEYLIKKEILIKEHFFGLYNGIHGISVGLAMLVKSGIIEHSEDVSRYILDCFEKLPISFDIVDGISGAGLALIHCRRFFDEVIFNSKLVFICETLINAQADHGGWVFEDVGSNMNELYTGFEIGNAGVIWFLLEAGQILSSDQIINCAILGVQWLINNSIFDGKRYSWNITPNRRDKGMLFEGSIGVCLTFIKAYEITGSILYKEIAEGVLHSRPDKIVMFEDQFAIGLPGLGEVYLEAFRIFKDDIWYKRAEWIAGLYMNSAIRKDNFVWWLQQDPKNPFVDLMTGNGSIVHFLLKFINPIDVKFNIFKP